MQEVTYIRNFLLHRANKQTYCVWNTVFSLWKKDDVNVKHGKKREEKKTCGGVFNVRYQHKLAIILSIHFPSYVP